MADAPRKRRWPWFLGIGLGLLAAAALWVHHQLDPERLARRVLDAIGEDQGLQISFEGTPIYGLWPQPRLVLPSLLVRQPGAAAPLLTAGRAEIAMPWDTVRGIGPVVITYVELDAPALDLAAFNDWRASRPPAPESEIPTLSRGVRVTDGRVQGEGWRAESLELVLGPVAPGRAAELEYSGRLHAGDFELTAAGRLTIDTPGDASDFRLLADGGIPLGDGTPAYRLEVDCRYLRAPPLLEVVCGETTFTADAPLPSLQLSGLSVRKGGPEQELAMRAEGTMPDWPEGWPTLPRPESAAAAGEPTTFAINYRGKADLSDPVSVEAQRGATRLQASGVAAELQAWFAQEPRAVLPPMQGRFSTPALVVEGFTLEGVQAELRETPAPETGREE